MFVLTVGHVDMITYPQTILLKEFILFIGLYYWSVHGHVYSNSWRYKRNYFHISIDILFYNLNTMKKHQTFIPRSFLQWRSWFGASPPPRPLFEAMPSISRTLCKITLWLMMLILPSVPCLEQFPYSSSHIILICSFFCDPLFTLHDCEYLWIFSKYICSSFFKHNQEVVDYIY